MKKILLGLVLLGFTACEAPKKTVSAGTVGSVEGVVGGILSGIQCAQSTSSTQGIIYEATQVQYAAGDAQGSFEDRAKALLSSAIMPQEIGSISPNANASTGVRFVGSLRLDQSGNVLGAQSKMTISFYDSIWLSEYSYNSSARGIDLAFDPTRSGQSISGNFNLQTGVGTLILKDAYGEIRFEGTIGAQNFSGLVKFQNSQSVVGTIAKGTLGNFSIARCAIVQ
ncbi:MAG: hypothetical protein H7328_03380 [Bdellovibrio sp.]|nr:hypothetical protein [Bdellovibrio sp.]